MSRTSRTQPLLRLAAVAASAGVALSAAPAATAAQTCTSRPAQTYFAGVTNSLPAPGPVPGAAVTPCITYTGVGAAESVLRTAPNGDLFYSTAFTKAGVGILRSKDLGDTWEYRNTTKAGGARRSRVQGFMDQDPTTGRLFLHTAKLDIRALNIQTGFDSTFSDDGGTTWTPTSIGIRAIDMLRYGFGKPVTSTLNGYPNIIYAMAPSPTSTPIGITTQLALGNPLQQVMIKSLDGGKTWAHAGAFSIRPTANGCPVTEWVLWSAIQVAADGTIYVAGRRCDKVGIAMSRDEGRTWTVSNVPNTRLPKFQTIFDPPSNPNYVLGDPLQIDSEGNIYLGYADANKRMRLTVSRDGGATWSEPVVISAPDVYGTYYPTITVKEPGRIGIGYLGVNGGAGANGYMAESTNALAARPTFTSQIINDPAKKLHPKGVQSGYITMFVGDDLNEWLHVRYAANGELFGAFTADMCPNGNMLNFACAEGWNYLGSADRSRWQAVVGRLKRG